MNYLTKEGGNLETEALKLQFRSEISGFGQ